MSSLRIALLGYGRIAELVHAGILLRAQGAALVAIAESDPVRRAAAGVRAPGARLFEDWRAALDAQDVDAVVITLPSSLHEDAALAAIAAGKHLYLEKPVAMDLAGGRRVLAAWREAKVVGMVGHAFRCHPRAERMRAAIEAGRIGAPLVAQSNFTVPSGALPLWKTRRESGGGALLDLAGHHVDLARFLLGREVKEARGALFSRASEDDTATVAFTLEGGITAQVFVALAGIELDRFEVVGERGHLVFDRHERSLWERLTAGRREPSFAISLARFIAAARTGAAGRDVTPSLEDGWKSLAALVAAERSARSGGGAVPVESAFEEPPAGVSLEAASAPRVPGA